MERPATPDLLHALRRAAVLTGPALERAWELTQGSPTDDAWRRYADRMLLFCGTSLVLAGVLYFFAWNWADLGHFTKFALIEAGIVVCVIATWKLGMDSAAGKAALFAAGFLVGTLFAVYGQVYQTGADPYGLFLAWALLVLPWALIGRQQGLWVLWIVLINLAVIMYWTQVLNPPGGLWQLAQRFGPLFLLGALLTDSDLSSIVFLINASALVLWETGAVAWRHPWMRGVLLPRVLAFLALAVVLPPTVIIILAATFGENVGLSLLSPALLSVATVACIYYYQFRKPDLFILTCCAIAVITTVTSIAINLMLGGAGSLLLLSLLLIAQVAGAAYWLRGVSHRWGSGR